MTMTRNAFAAHSALISVFSSAASYADSILTQVDLSAKVIESVLPGGTIFHDSKPLFGVTVDPLVSAELLHLSDTGVNASGRSTSISGAFARPLPSALFSEARADVVDQHIAHGRGSHSHEIRPALPRALREPKPSLVHQRSGLQARLRRAPSQIKGGKPVQFRVDALHVSRGSCFHGHT
jgi:hypothetical protein